MLFLFIDELESRLEEVKELLKVGVSVSFFEYEAQEFRASVDYVLAAALKHFEQSFVESAVFFSGVVNSEKELVSSQEFNFLVGLFEHRDVKADSKSNHLDSVDLPEGALRV